MVRLLQSIRNALKQLDVAIKLPGDGVEQSELAQAILSKVPAKEIAYQASQLFYQLQLWAENSHGVVVMHGIPNNGNIASNLGNSIVAEGQEPMTHMKSVRFPLPPIQNQNIDMISPVNIVHSMVSPVNIVHSMVSPVNFVHSMLSPVNSVHSIVSPVNNGIGSVNSIDRPVFPNVTTHGNIRPANLTSGFANPSIDGWEQRQSTSSQSKYDSNSIMEPTFNSMPASGHSVDNMVFNPMEHQFGGASNGSSGPGMYHQPPALTQMSRSSKDYPREPIPRFSAEGRTFLDGFNFLHILVKHCEYFQWSTMQWQLELRGHFCEETWMWYYCLLSEVQCNFQAFARSFKERWMDDPCPASVRYYRAKQQDDESIEVFFTKLIYYAQNAGINVRTQWYDVFNHFQCCLNIESEQLIGSMHFDTHESFCQFLSDHRVRQHLRSAYLSWSNDLPPVTQINCATTTMPIPNRPISVSCQTDCASLAVPLRSTSPIYLRSGQTRVIPICMDWNNELATYWMNRGPKWVATLLYDDASQPSAIRVTNTSNDCVMLGSQVLLGQSINPGHEPVSDTMIMVTSRAYEERQFEVKKNRYTRRYLAKMSARLSPQPVIDHSNDIHVAAIWKRVVTDRHVPMVTSDEVSMVVSIAHSCPNDVELDTLLDEALTELSKDEYPFASRSRTASYCDSIPILPPAEPPPMDPGGLRLL